MRSCRDNDTDESKTSSYFDLSEFNVNKRDMMSRNNKPSSSQPATAAVNSIHWNVEEDHLLSYFLGANEGTNDNSPEGIDIEKNPHGDPINVEPTSIRATSQPNSSANIYGGGVAHASSLESFVHAGLPPAHTEPVNFNDGHYLPANNSQGTVPSTMAMGAMAGHNSVGYNSFVHASQQQRHSSNSLKNRTSSAGSMHKVPSRTSTTSSGSSSSSLASMAAALALGGPNQVMYMQQKLQSCDQMTSVHHKHQLNNTSPITPLHMMGISPSGQEMMMLPPPPRFPNGNNPGMMQHPHNNMHQAMHQPQHTMYTQQSQMPMHQQPNTLQQSMPQQPPVVPSNRPSQQPTNNIASQENKQPNFLPQMNPTVGSTIHSNLTTQHTRPMDHMGFPDPNSVTNAVLAQPQLQQQQPQHPAQPQHQIQIGLNGQTIPITAVSNANGSVYYQIDPSVVPTAGLRYFTKAINEVSKPEETELDPKVLAEKRKQRLARNRESARQSRRRKKDHLTNLGDKVQKLQTQLELEVRNKVRSMEGGLVRQRAGMLDKWLVGYEEERKKLSSDSSDEPCVNSERCRRELALAVQKTSANCQIRRAVITHQYNMLRQAFLSSRNHYSVWMMMQSSSFFTEAVRQQHIKQGTDAVAGDNGSVGDGSASKTATSRANSKQIGEEIFYEQQMEGKGNVTCDANDEVKTWPLYCHEVTMTMDQEDRIINQAHVQAKSTPDLQAKLQKMKTVTDATHHLQNAMLCHTQLASTRNEMLLLEILTPAQTALFKDYMKKNKERLMAIMERQLRASFDAGLAGNAQPDSTLGGVYQQLEEMRLQE